MDRAETVGRLQKRPTLLYADENMSEVIHQLDFHCVAMGSIAPILETCLVGAMVGKGRGW